MFLDLGETENREKKEKSCRSYSNGEGAKKIIWDLADVDDKETRRIAHPGWPDCQTSIQTASIGTWRHAAYLGTVTVRQARKLAVQSVTHLPIIPTPASS